MRKYNKENKRSYGRELYDRQSIKPDFRTQRVLRYKDYIKNRAPAEVLDRRSQYQKLYKKRQRVWRRALALDHYGGKCVCCGETRDFFLGIDHIGGGGNKHRRAIKMGDVGTWLFDNNWPGGFQVLCFNCNMAKRRLNVCPC